MIHQLYTRVNALQARARLYYQLKLPWCLLQTWQLKGLGNLFIAEELNTVAIHRIDGVAVLSRYCWHVDGEVFVHYQQLWHVRSSPVDTFSDFVF
jgi:hypothetical protein